jgi:hypothetical protein
MAVFLGAVVVILVSLHAGAIVPFIVASTVVGAAQGTTFAGSMRAARAGHACRARGAMSNRLSVRESWPAMRPGMAAPA